MEKEELVRIIKKQICTLVPGIEENQIELNDPLAELGATSIVQARIIHSTAKRHLDNSVQFDLCNIKNIGDLVDSIYYNMK